MTSLQETARKFDQDGFVILRQLFSADEISELKQQLDDFIRHEVPLLEPGQVYFEDVPSRPIKAIHRLEARSAYFRRLLAEPRILQVVQTIFAGSDILPEAVMYFAKQGGAGSVTPAHQDNAFQHWDPPEALTVTVAVDESTPANGPLICLKGSHKLGVLPHRQSGVLGFSRALASPANTRVYREVALCLEPGDVALHHINTIHRSEANPSPRHRRQIGLGYRSTRARRDEQGHERYLQDLDRLHKDNRAALESADAQGQS